MRIPARFVPNRKKQIDFDAEAAAFLGAAFSLKDGLLLPSPPVGFFTCLELITSPYFLSPLECEAQDFFNAMALLAAGRRAVFLADSFRKGDNGPLLQEAEKFEKEHGETAISQYEEIVYQTLVLPFEGLAMIPSAGRSGKEFLYDAEFLAALTGCVAMTTGESIDSILWDMPLLRAGHIQAFRMRYEGNDRIERPDDPEAVKKALKEATERERVGELHPWQIAEPENYPPTDQQIMARFEIIAEHKQLLEKKINDVQGKKDKEDPGPASAGGEGH